MVSPVAATTSKDGWAAQMRSSSAPVKPDAPTMPTSTMALSYIILNTNPTWLTGVRPVGEGPACSGRAVDDHLPHHLAVGDVLKGLCRLVERVRRM